MPCWCTQLNEMSLTGMTGEKLELFSRALKSLGYFTTGSRKGFEEYELVADHLRHGSSVLVKNGRVIFGISAGSATVTTQQVEAQVRKEYLAQVVETGLKKFGWQQQQTSAGKIRATRRY